MSTSTAPQQPNRGCWCPELKGKVALVTGAGRYRSIGRQVVLELARQGVHVVLTGTGRDPKNYPPEEQKIGWRDIASVAEEAEAIGVKALALVSDVSDPKAVGDVVAKAVAQFGGVDILINNAGAAVGKDRVPVLELSVEDWNRVLRPNLDGAFYMSQAVARAMVARGKGGCIINISSIAAREAAVKTAAYAVSKAGLNTLSRVMAMELVDHGIRVNAVLPGLIKTSRMRVMIPDERFDEFAKKFTPMGVAGNGTEIATICTYLCSDMGAWITGQDFAVDGGKSWH